MKKSLYRSALAVLSLVITITSVPPVYAADVPGDLQYRNSNEVLYASLYASTCNQEGGSGTLVSGKDNIEKIWNYLVKKGLTDNQAAGVMGNIQQESTFNPFLQEKAHGFGGGGYGITQWTNPGRRDAFVKTMKSKLGADFTKYYTAEYSTEYLGDQYGWTPKKVPVEINDKFLTAQLDYLHEESKSRTVLQRTVEESQPFGSGSEWEAITRAGTIKQASDVWLYSFERPGAVISGGRITLTTPSSIKASEGRASMGEAIYKKIKGAAANPSTDTPTDDPDDTSVLPITVENNPIIERCSMENTNPGSVEALQALVLKYADPEKRLNRKGYTNKTKAYEEAVKNAKSSGVYTGDPCHGGGVDCGAFVTLLLINSGWEPNYNYGGKYAAGAGNTIHQEAWMKKNWERLGRGNELKECTDTSDPKCLRPGDVAINADHTFVYVGKFEGWQNSTIASASQCGKAPSAGWETVLDGAMTYYRKKAGSGDLAA